MTPTPQQWAAAKKALSGHFGDVDLVCDGYELHIERGLIDKNTLGLVPYVNGSFKGSWLLTDCEERRRFMRPVTIFSFKASFRRKMTKLLGKRGAARYQERRTYYRWDWPTFDPLRRHLLKNNHSVHILKINGKDAEQ